MPVTGSALAEKTGRRQKMDDEVYNKGEIIVPINEHGELTLRVDDKVVRLYHSSIPGD